MSNQFGRTSHSEIAKAFEAEGRVHTFVEQVPVPGSQETVLMKKYQLRLSLEELLTMLDALKASGSILATRQLRGKVLATLGLFEEG